MLTLPTLRFLEPALQSKSGASFQYARDNIARIHIYYDDMKVRDYEV